MPILITTVKKLKEISLETTEIYIALNGGAKSSKTITFLPEECKFQIINHIDESEQLLSTRELNTHSNIKEAMEKEALYSY
jgi:hypothetical protein